jgi:hypothetical protein
MAGATGRSPPSTIPLIDQLAVIKNILQHLGLWEESHVSPDRGFPKLEITFDHSFS